MKYRLILGRTLLVLVSTIVTLKASDLFIGWINPFGISHFRHKHAFGQEALQPWQEHCTGGFTIMELVPDHITQAGCTYQINSLGFRDDEVAITKAPDTWRIVVIGDSVTFGWGVEAEERFTDVLEHRWNASHSRGPRLEIINLGVPAYETTHECLVFRDRALPLEPDVIVFVFNWNDVQLVPDEVIAGVGGGYEKRQEKKSNTTQLVAAFLSHPTVQQTLITTLPSIYGLLAYSSIYSLQPGDDVVLRDIYASMEDGIRLSSDLLEKAMIVANEKGIRFAVVDLYDFSPIATELGKRKTPYRNIAFKDFVSDMNLRNSPSDPHPNARGHARLADTFEEALQSLNLLPESP